MTNKEKNNEKKYTFNPLYKNINESVVESFRYHKRYEVNTQPSLCDGIPPKTIAELYDYFVVSGQVDKLFNDFSEEEIEKNEEKIDKNLAYNQYDSVDDMLSLSQYINSVSDKADNFMKGEGVKRSETTTTADSINTNEVKQEKKEEEKEEK